MICFPNAKINIGLKVIEKRKDGFHNIESVFYPIALCDILEVIKHPTVSKKGYCEFTSSGLEISGSVDSNLCVKAYNLLHQEFNLPSIQIHLHKIIPMGAGLGGGSADGAFMLKSLNSLFDLRLTAEKLEEYAGKVGSDCPFFIENIPAFVFDRGVKFNKVDLDLSNYHFVLVNPNIHVGTAEAYQGITPQKSSLDLQKMINLPILKWQENSNDFEKYVFTKHLKVAKIKDELKSLGAVFTSMTGSGSTVYGLFEKLPLLNGKFDGCFVWSN